MLHQRLLQHLDAQLAQLTQAIAQSTTYAGSQPRFDQQLFQSRGNQLKDYLAEARQTCDRLKRHIADGNRERTAWLAEHATAQLEALRREIATQHLRDTRQSATSAQQRLGEKVAEYYRFEQRLRAMLAERETQLGRVETLQQQQHIQRELVALEERLARCQSALASLERELIR
ncbi:Prephenate dehydrogenase [Paramixta manurensis]|uniref:Prephenate dehydrogenase n=1 Tax=Paramixta manurensis TaxID=2740817 RepID=A0A6M8ULB5_9GAMM|nr:Prephenate dehydrogenase [Erwiniaceae bacterium PD-1]